MRKGRPGASFTTVLAVTRTEVPTLTGPAVQLITYTELKFQIETLMYTSET